MTISQFSRKRLFDGFCRSPGQNSYNFHNPCLIQNHFFLLLSRLLKNSFRILLLHKFRTKDAKTSGLRRQKNVSGIWEVNFFWLFTRSLLCYATLVLDAREKILLSICYESWKMQKAYLSCLLLLSIKIKCHWREWCLKRSNALSRLMLCL